MFYPPITNDISTVRALKAIETSRLLIFTSYRFQMQISSLKYENTVQSILNTLSWWRVISTYIFSEKESVFSMNLEMTMF